MALGATSSLIVEFCQLFYQLRWCTGSGGALSIRVDNQALITPSSVQKERVKEEELFVIDIPTGTMTFAPEGFSASSCVPLFLQIYKIRDAGAIFHTHSIHAVLITLIYDDYFRISHQEMIKGIEGHQFFDTLEVPIINNRPREHLLEDIIAETVQKNPRCPAVLVRQHGLFVWGKDWQQAKIQLECLDYLFRLALKMRKLSVPLDVQYSSMEGENEQKGGEPLKQ